MNCKSESYNLQLSVQGLPAVALPGHSLNIPKPRLVARLSEWCTLYTSAHCAVAVLWYVPVRRFKRLQYLDGTA